MEELYYHQLSLLSRLCDGDDDAAAAGGGEGGEK
jgi:hypothetical protein